MGYEEQQQYQQPQRQQQFMPDSFSSAETRTREAGLSEDKALVVQWIIDNNDLITSLEHSLRNERFVPAKDKNDSDRWVRPKDLKPLVNDVGLNVVISLINMRLSKIFKVTYLKTAEINSIAYEFEIDLLYLLADRAEDYGIEEGYIESIVSLCGTSVYAILKSSEDARMLDFLSQTSRVVETHGMENKGEKKSFFGGLFKV